MLGDLLDLIFPPKCAGCDAQGALLCASCRDALPLIDPRTACPRCGAPVEPGARVCSECRGREFAFSAARCAARLESPVSRAVVVLKDSGERRYARVLGELLAGCVDGWLTPDDVLVPAPASPAAVRRRGFDHSADIARALGRLTGNEVRCLLQATPGADQRALGRDERFANRAGMFSVRAGVEVLARAVLVDDVLTTGATLDAAARALRAAGVDDVRALAVARSCGCGSCPSVVQRIHL